VSEVTSNPGNNPDVDNSSTNDDNSSSSSSSSSDSDNHSEESCHAPVRSVTAKPRRTEVHQYYRSAKNRLGQLFFCLLLIGKHTTYSYFLLLLASNPFKNENLYSFCTKKESF
jgi:hypothetical protein